MKIGIIHTYLPGQDACGITQNHTDRIKDFLLEYRSDFTFEVYEATLGQLPKSVSECDAYVVSGSKFGVYEEHAWIPALITFLRSVNEAKHKLAGICFGHQIIAKAMGGSVSYGNTGYMLGIYEAYLHIPEYAERLTKNWLSPNTLEHFYIHYAHQDYVTDLPHGAVNIITSPHCKNAGFIIGEHILTIQGHPEYTNEYVEKVFEVFGDRLPEETLSNGQKTLSEKAANRDALKNIFGNFLYR